MLDEPDALGGSAGSDRRRARLHFGDCLLIGREPLGDHPLDGGAARAAKGALVPELACCAVQGVALAAARGAGIAGAGERPVLVEGVRRSGSSFISKTSAFRLTISIKSGRRALPSSKPVL